jgi:hypothetical protein
MEPPEPETFVSLILERVRGNRVRTGLAVRYLHEMGISK